MSPPKKDGLVPFKFVAGVPAYYARTNAAYADLSKCTKRRTRVLDPNFLRLLDASINEIALLCHASMGPLTAITSGGAYVEKPGQHRLGRAYDLGGLHWGGEVLTCIDVASSPLDDDGTDHHRHLIDRHRFLLYLAVEAVLRKWFGTVLGMHHDKLHANHWHVDTSTRVGYWPHGRGSRTRVRYLQETLTQIWDMPCGKPDGVAGRKTRAAVKQVLKHHGLRDIRDGAVWLQYLTLTAMRATAFQ